MESEIRGAVFGVLIIGLLPARVCIGVSRFLKLSECSVHEFGPVLKGRLDLTGALLAAFCMHSVEWTAAQCEECSTLTTCQETKTTANLEYPVPLTPEKLVYIGILKATDSNMKFGDIGHHVLQLDVNLWPVEGTLAESYKGLRN